VHLSLEIVKNILVAKIIQVIEDILVAKNVHAQGCSCCKDILVVGHTPLIEDSPVIEEGPMVEEDPVVTDILASQKALSSLKSCRLDKSVVVDTLFGLLQQEHLAKYFMFLYQNSAAVHHPFNVALPDEIMSLRDRERFINL
jgi:hypothetical protein